MVFWYNLDSMKEKNNCITVIENRKSVRSFSDRQVNETELMDILDCARLAPSAKNRQPWKFVILSADEKSRVLETFKAKLDSGVDEPSGYASLKIMNNASRLVLVFLESEKIESAGLRLTPYYLSVGASIENALLRATELGISTLWVYDLVVIEEELKQRYFKEGLFISAICFGYEDKVLPRAQKKSLEDIIIRR